MNQATIEVLANQKKVEHYSLNYDAQKPAYSPGAISYAAHGSVSEKIVCSQCGEKGYVHTRKVSKKAGVSGGKATAALLTIGLSLFVTGLSRSEKLTKAYCGNCESQWFF